MSAYTVYQQFNGTFFVLGNIDARNDTHAIEVAKQRFPQCPHPAVRRVEYRGPFDD